MVARRGRSSTTPPSTPTGSGRIDLPHLMVDPIWCLKPWPVLIDVAGEELVIPAMCAADWLSVLMDPGLSPDDVIPGLLGEDDADFVETLLHEGEIAWMDMQELALEVIGQVTGRPWWVALRLIHTARDNWDAVGGELAMKINPALVTVGAWLDAVFMVILRGLDDDKRTMFLMKLELAPEGAVPAAKDAFESADAAFDAMEMSPDAFMALAR